MNDDSKGNPEERVVDPNAVDPKEIRDQMPEKWEVKEKFTEQVNKMTKDIEDSKELEDLKGLHPILRAVFTYLIKFDYIEMNEEEFGYLKDMMLTEHKGMIERSLKEIVEKKFNEMYMEAVQAKAKANREKNSKVIPKTAPEEA